MLWQLIFDMWYNCGMDTNLTPEQSAAIGKSGGEPITFTDPATERQYVLISADQFEELESISAIRTGIKQMENGEGQPLKEAFSEIRSALTKNDD